MAAMSMATWGASKQAPVEGEYGVYVIAHWSPELPMVSELVLEDEELEGAELELEATTALLATSDVDDAGGAT